jgi:hypothetical protein
VESNTETAIALVGLIIGAVVLVTLLVMTIALVIGLIASAVGLAIDAAARSLASGGAKQAGREVVATDGGFASWFHDASEEVRPDRALGTWARRSSRSIGARIRWQAPRMEEALAGALASAAQIARRVLAGPGDAWLPAAAGHPRPLPHLHLFEQVRVASAWRERRRDAWERTLAFLGYAGPRERERQRVLGRRPPGSRARNAAVGSTQSRPAPHRAA